MENRTALIGNSILNYIRAVSKYKEKWSRKEKVEQRVLNDCEIMNALIIEYSS